MVTFQRVLISYVDIAPSNHRHAQDSLPTRKAPVHSGYYEAGSLGAHQIASIGKHCCREAPRLSA